MLNEKHITRLYLNGFKSINEAQLELNNLNIIVGTNGVGKSNLLSFFTLLRAFMKGSLNLFTMLNGGAGDMLFNGKEVTKCMKFAIEYFPGGYGFILYPTVKNEFTVKNEISFSATKENELWNLWDSPNEDFTIEKLTAGEDFYNDCKWLVNETIDSWKVYYFHESNNSTGMRHYEIVQDADALREDAANLAPFLLSIKTDYPNEYQEIVNATRTVIPNFEDFLLTPRVKGSREEVNLGWSQKNSDFPMQPYHFSDGSIRFICLATALLQPNPPATIIIDEPELGLHPLAISVLAELILATSKKTQIIISTQSPLLASRFTIDDIIVTSAENGMSTFTRLNEIDFVAWLKEYSLGNFLS